MKVIVAGYFEFVNEEDVPVMLKGAKPHIDGALQEEGCIAYSWTEDHLTPGRVWVYEEWTSEETLEAHLNSHWYRDMGGYMASFERKPMNNIIMKYRVEKEEPVYDTSGVAKGHFFAD